MEHPVDENGKETQNKTTQCMNCGVEYISSKTALTTIVGCPCCGKGTVVK